MGRFEWGLAVSSSHPQNSVADHELRLSNPVEFPPGCGCRLARGRERERGRALSPLALSEVGWGSIHVNRPLHQSERRSAVANAVRENAARGLEMVSIYYVNRLSEPSEER
eukprot:scaffold215420_cov18-Tisochrysis_lutea.AAC.1